MSADLRKCDRCGERAWATIMSMFNRDELCLDCSDAEEKHPDFEIARAAEAAACRRGHYNFPGIGWPGADGRVRQEVRERWQR